MKLDAELEKAIKKYGETKKLFEQINFAHLVVDQNQSMMMIAGILKQIGTEFELLNRNIEMIGDIIRNRL
jgi:hypothetical protein